MTAIGIDVGGTFIKGARLVDGQVVGQVIRTRVPDFIDTSGLAREIDPDALMAAVRAVLDALLHATDAPSSIWITGQMASMVFVDEKGESVAPIVSWQDERSGSVDHVREALGSAVIGATGEVLRPSLPLVRLTSIMVPPGAKLTSLLAFVAGSLCGLRARAVHVTDAAAWGLLNLNSRHWSEPILEFIHLSDDDLPDVVNEFVPVGNDVRSGAPVIVALSDQQSSLLGAGIGTEAFVDCVSVNLATGCQVSVVSVDPVSQAQLRPYFQDSWLRTVTHLPAGRLLTSAVERETGGTSESHWEAAHALAKGHGEIDNAVSAITSAVVRAIELLGASNRRIRFSGGLVQRFTPLQAAILNEINVCGSCFPGDDAALSGLAILVNENRDQKPHTRLGRGNDAGAIPT